MGARKGKPKEALQKAIKNEFCPNFKGMRKIFEKIKE